MDPCEPFVGSEALAAGLLTRSQLRSRFTRVFPDVYLTKHIAEPSLRQRIRAAWLWSERRGVIAGTAAAALHDARWVPPDAPVELIHRNPRPPDGVLTRRERLLGGEVQLIDDMTTTTQCRTAFDIGRRGPLATAVARMDALLRATGVASAAVCEIAGRHPRAKGLRQLEMVLDLTDPGAQSPKETWLRLVLIRGGLPRPHTQIPVAGPDGFIAYLDLGWPKLLIAVEYDGDHHRTERGQYVKDIRRRELLRSMGWIVITVVAGDRPGDIVQRVRAAMERRSSVR